MHKEAIFANVILCYTMCFVRIYVKPILNLALKKMGKCIVELLRSPVVSPNHTVSNSKLQKVVFQCYTTKYAKDFRAFGVAVVRHVTAATAAFTLACLFTEWLCYVLGRLHS
jgi:hypothetical protein